MDDSDEMELPEEFLPKVVLYKDLRGLDKNGRNCESCNSSMLSHNWVLMDHNGFVIFCDSYRISALRDVMIKNLEMDTDHISDNDPKCGE
jgi:hypothetical protein